MEKKEAAENHIEAREALVEEARKFNLLSNVFMSVALDDVAACQHVLRILLGRKDLRVRKIRSQYRISKVTSHDAILDILAENSDGKLCNIEIQRADTVDHARRSRFYGAMIDSQYLEKGKKYDELPEVHIIYISETDIWKAGHTTYAVEKRFKDTEILYDDGFHVLYVNAAVDDGSETAELMRYFKTANPKDMSQGDLSKRVHFLKCEEGGYKIMCEISEKIYRKGIERGIERGIEKGIEKGIIKGKKEERAEMVRKFLLAGASMDLIKQATGWTEEQIVRLK